jgi:predicted enzyme related to lactoylglutathione lyase
LTDRSFHWNELLTNDPEAAKRFYVDIVGWTTQAMPMPSGGTYTILMNGEQPAAGIMDIKETHAPAGTPPHWTAYIAVDDVDAAVVKVEKGGGKVHVPCFDVEGIGRIAMIEDPTGAVIGIMTPAAAS